MRLEDIIKAGLGCTSVQSTGFGGGGCISQGSAFKIDGKDLVFVKENEKPKAQLMFDGEFASLEALDKTGCIKVPKPIKVLTKPIGVGSYLVMEYLKIQSLNTKASEQLGNDLARLHLQNPNLGDSGDEGYVSKFGFHVQTCCGYLPQSNKWEDDWIVFYTNKLQEQIDMAEVNYHDADAKQCWQKLKPKIPKFFEGIVVRPSLLHGDLWSGNAGQVDGKHVVFDAASFYGHHEYDLGIAGMFGGFGSSFYNAYHAIIPKEHGFEQRHQLYQLFHYLNHWNHFGGGYKSQSISIMKRLSAS